MLRTQNQMMRMITVLIPILIVFDLKLAAARCATYFLNNKLNLIAIVNYKSACDYIIDMK